MEIPRKCKSSLQLVAAAVFLGTSVTGWATGNLTTVKLPKGVSIELPKNWVVFSNNQRIALDTAMKSALDLSGTGAPPSELPFAANLYDDRGRTLAILNIRYYPELDLSQADARCYKSKGGRTGFRAETEHDQGNAGPRRVDNVLEWDCQSRD